MAGASGQASPNFVIGELSIEPAVTHAGGPVTLSFRVSNVGDQDGEYNVPVLVDGAQEERVTGELPPGGSRTHFVPIIRSGANTHQVQVGEQIVTFTVSAASFLVTALELFPSLISPGERLEVAGTVTNVGGVPDTYDVVLRVNGVPQGQRSGLLPPGASAPFLFSVAGEKPGTSAVSVGQGTASFMVLGPLLRATLGQTVPVVPQVTTAQDDLGGPVEVMDGAVTLRAEDGGRAVVELPVALRPRRRLVAFRDLASGVSFADGVLALPLRLDGGTGSANLVAEMAPPVGSGVTARALAEKPRLQLLGILVDLGVADQELGLVSLDLELDLPNFPLGASLDLWVRKELSPARRERLDAAARAAGQRVADIALVLELVERERERSMITQGGQLRFALGSSWVDRYGLPSSVRGVGWASGDGLARILATRHQGRDSRGRLLFAASVPPGFTSLAILAVVPAPPDMAALVPGVTLDPPAAVPGEVVQVRATIVNSGPSPLVVPLTLLVSGVRQRTKTLVLGAGEQGFVSFYTSFSEAGTYAIKLGEEEATLLVAPPLDPLEVQGSDLLVSPLQTHVGKPVQVSLQVKNAGSQVGRAHPLVRLNGVLARGLPVVLGPGESKRVQITLTLDLPGPYHVEVDGLEASFVLAPAPSPAALVLSELSVSPSIVDPGQQATVSFKVTNTGGTAGSLQAVLDIGGETQAVGPFLVPEHTTLPLTIEVAPYTPGSHTIRLGGQEAVLVVRNAVATTFRVTSLEVDPGVVKAGHPVRVRAVVTNVEEVLGVGHVTLKVDGLVAGTERLWLGPGVSREVEFTVVETQLGAHALDLNGELARFTVERAFSLILMAGTGAAVLLLAATVGYAVLLQRQGRLPTS